MTFSRKDAMKLRLKCNKELRRNNVKIPSDNIRKRVRKGFKKRDDSKIRVMKSTKTYWNWVEENGGKEPTEANPDFWEERNNDKT